MLDFYVKTRIRFSLRDKRLFEITEVEITRVDCTSILGEPKRRKPNKLKPIEKQNGADMSQFQQPKKDRENFRKALVDIIM